MTYPTTTIDLDGKKIIIETGHFGAQAAGSVTVRCGDTIVIASVGVGEPKPGMNYFPLQLEYQEKHYAGGVISSSRFVKREGRPSENEILTGRVIDRSLRPLFDQASRNDVQILVSPLSYDGENEPEILAIIAASAAVSVSDYPWTGPVGAVRVGLSADGKYIANPTVAEKLVSDLDLVVSGPKGGITMVESGAKEASEEAMIGALNFAQSWVDTIATAIDSFAKEHGKAKRTLNITPVSADLKKIVESEIGDIKALLKNEALKTGTQLSAVVRSIFAAHPELIYAEIDEYANELIKVVARKEILESGLRPDGRQIEDIRIINCEVGLLPRTHGSGYFQRGLTHVLSVVTLASPAREQLIDGMKGEQTKRYMHHYNMPGYASGEVGRVGTGRREIGHGALAERALFPMLPDQSSFPYTIRVVSEVVSSNGSTSQGSICGSTLSLMDAGVPLKKPVAGVAMGLIAEGNKFVTLTDICGLEDHLGDMDFKVAGTADGITALQMDVKVPGVTAAILTQALEQAKRGRLNILAAMLKVLAAPRPDLSAYAPRIVSIMIPVDKIGDIIGTGGKIIRQIQTDYSIEINIEGTGEVTITGTDSAKVAAAKALIEGMVASAEVGMTYQGKVARVEAFGAFVNILPGKDGLVHISQIQPEAFKNLKVGDKLEVRCYQIDELGRVNLTTLQEGEAPIRAERPMGARPFTPGGDRSSTPFRGGDRGSRPAFKKFRDSR